MKPAIKGAATGGAALLAAVAAWFYWGDDPKPDQTAGDETVVQQPSGKVVDADNTDTGTTDPATSQSDQTAGDQTGAATDTQGQSDDQDQSGGSTQTAALSNPDELDKPDDASVTADQPDDADQSDGTGQNPETTDTDAPSEDTEPLDGNATDADTDASEGAASTETTDADAEPEDPLAPRFDVVRVDPNGQTVLAGKAEPGKAVEIILDGEVIAEATADRKGNFVSILDLDLSGGAQSLQLRVAKEDGAEGAIQTAETTVGSDDENTVDADQSDQAQSDDSAQSDTSQQSTGQSAGLSDQEPEVQNTESALVGPNLVNGKVPPVGENPSGETPSGEASESLAAVQAPQDSNPVLPQPTQGPEVPSVEIAAIQPGEVSADGVSVNADVSDASRPNVQPQETNGAGFAAVSPLPDAPEEVEAGRYRLSAPVIILPSTEEGASPTLVQPKAEELALIQPEKGDVRGVVLDRISYSDVGDVKLSGRGRDGRAIRIYGNGLLIGTTRVAQDGTWAIALASERGKTIKLFRFDELDPGGGVSSRIETPFEYSSLSPKVVRQRKVVIQRGDVLWRIAEQYYGEGVRYSLIYGANTELIRDPDLIYPGQEFSIPELVDAN